MFYIDVLYVVNMANIKTSSFLFLPKAKLGVDGILPPDLKTQFTLPEARP